MFDSVVLRNSHVGDYNGFLFNLAKYAISRNVRFDILAGSFANMRKESDARASELGRSVSASEPSRETMPRQDQSQVVTPLRSKKPM